MEAFNEALAKLTNGKNVFSQTGYLAMLTAVQNPATNPLAAHSEFLQQQFMSLLAQRNVSLQPVTRSLSPSDQSTVNTFLASQDFSPPLRLPQTPEKKNKSPFAINSILDDEGDPGEESASTSSEPVSHEEEDPASSTVEEAPPVETTVAPADQEAVEALQELKNMGTKDVINNNCLAKDDDGLDASDKSDTPQSAEVEIEKLEKPNTVDETKTYVVDSSDDEHDEMKFLDDIIAEDLGKRDSKEAANVVDKDDVVDVSNKMDDNHVGNLGEKDAKLGGAVNDSVVDSLNKPEVNFGETSKSEAAVAESVVDDEDGPVDPFLDEEEEDYPIVETPKRKRNVAKERKPRVYKPRASTKRAAIKITTPQNVLLARAQAEPEFKVPTPPDRARVQQIQKLRRIRAEREAEQDAEKERRREEARMRAEQEHEQELQKKNAALEVKGREEPEVIVLEDDDTEEASQPFASPEKEKGKVHEVIDLSSDEEDDDKMPNRIDECDVDLVFEALVGQPEKPPQVYNPKISLLSMVQETWKDNKLRKQAKAAEVAKTQEILYKKIKMEPEDVEEMPEVKYDDPHCSSNPPPYPITVDVQETESAGTETTPKRTSPRKRISTDRETDRVEQQEIDKAVRRINKACKKKDEEEVAKAAENAGELQAEDTSSSAGTPSISPPRSRKRRSSKETPIEPKRRSARIKDNQANPKPDNSVFFDSTLIEEESPEKTVKRPRARANKKNTTPKKRVRAVGVGITKRRRTRRKNIEKLDEDDDEEDEEDTPRKRKYTSRIECNRHFYEGLSMRLLNGVVFPSAEGECKIMDHFQYPVVRRAIMNKNTLCYSISMMQVMLRVPQIYSIIRSHNHANNERVEGCFLCMLAQFLTTKPSNDDRRVFINLLKETWPAVIEDEMHCCMEAMQHFFDRFDVDFQKYHPTYIQNAEKGHSPTRNFFEIEMITKYTCTDCQADYEVKDRAVYLSIDLTKKTNTTMQGSVENITTQNTTTGMECQACGNTENFSYVTRFVKLPEVLLYFVPRVRTKKNDKDMTVVEVQKELTVKSQDDVEHHYSLCAFVTHHGDNGRKGHYKTFEVDHHREDQPYNEFDDHKVTIDALLTWDMTVVLAMFRKVDAVQRDDPIDLIFDGRGNIAYANEKYGEAAENSFRKHY